MVDRAETCRSGTEYKGNIVIGTVKGDIHDLAKHCDYASKDRVIMLSTWGRCVGCENSRGSKRTRGPSAGDECLLTGCQDP